MDDALMAFRRGEIVRETRWARLRRLRRRCCKASAQAAELKVEAAGIVRLNGDAGSTKRSVATTKADPSDSGATCGDAAATSLQVPGRCVRAVVRCQQIFRHRRQARGEEEHRRSRERQRVEREQVDSRKRCLVRQIEYLKGEWGTGKDVQVAIDSCCGLRRRVRMRMPWPALHAGFGRIRWLTRRAMMRWCGWTFTRRVQRWRGFRRSRWSGLSGS